MGAAITQKFRVNHNVVADIRSKTNPNLSSQQPSRLEYSSQHLQILQRDYCQKLLGVITSSSLEIQAFNDCTARGQPKLTRKCQDRATAFVPVLGEHKKTSWRTQEDGIEYLSSNNKGEHNRVPFHYNHGYCTFEDERPCDTSLVGHANTSFAPPSHLQFCKLPYTSASAAEVSFTCVLCLSPRS